MINVPKSTIVVATVLLLLALSVFYSGCSPRQRQYAVMEKKILKLWREGEWTKLKRGQIVAYIRDSRVAGYSNYAIRPAVIDFILAKENAAIKYIEDRLDVRFPYTVTTNLFHRKEAGYRLFEFGGLALSRVRTLGFVLWQTNTNNMANVFLARHEMAHVVADTMIGPSQTSLFAEGYAVALTGDGGWETNSDGSNKMLTLDERMRGFATNGLIMKPSKLIDNTKVVYDYLYPQGGYLIDWMFKRYGVGTVNRLYGWDAKRIIRDFKWVTGESFAAMEKAYLRDCSKKFNGKIGTGEVN